MNQKSIINGRKYTFLKQLPSLDDSGIFVVCADDCGKEYICPEDLWRDGVIAAEQHAPIHSQSSAQEKITFFLSMFKGREGIYARRYYSAKSGKSGYTPVCKNEWAVGLCDKRTHRCPECPNREFLPLSHEAVRAHLLGRDRYCRDVAAVYPMLEDHTTWLLAVDFDKENWKPDVAAFCKTCEDVGLTPAVERSRSGNGAHIWFFFSEPIPAADARRLGSGLLTYTMADRHEISFSSYDRLFPSQDYIPSGGFGNLIALPFQGQAQKNGNSLFVDSRFMPYTDQWAYLSSLPKISPDQLDACVKRLCRDGDLGELAADEKHEPWTRRSHQKRLNKGDFPLQAKLVISNLIYVNKQGYSQAALNAVKRMAAFPNPEFRAKQAMRLPVYGTPRVLDCGYEDDAYIGIPRGCRDLLFELLEQYEVPFTLEDKRCMGRSIHVAFHGTLRQEQEPAAAALLSEEMGVLSATTAFGKTVIGAYLIGQRKVNTLILVHSSALLEQWKSALEQFLNISEELPEQPKKRGRKKKQHLIGQIGSGKNTRSGIVDIAIMQSLFEGDEKAVKSFVADYGMVMVDECHHVAAFTFESILKTVEAKYVYGLSATPARKDGHHPIIFMQCGPIRYLVDAKSQAEKRAFLHYVFPRFTNTRLPDANGIQELYTGIAENESRNRLLVEDTLRLIQEGRTPILLTERKEHAAKLAAQLEKHIKNVFLLIGSDKQREKQEKLTALQLVPTDEAVVVVATGKYVGEGFDSPRLDTLLLAMPISWKGTLAQYAGRLHRNYEGKEEVRIYDYVDIHVPALERMYHKRLKGYTELGYQVRFGGKEDTSGAIYDGYAAMEPFEKDLVNAGKSVVLISPFLQKGRAAKLLPVIRQLTASGVAVHIHTRSPESYDAEHQKNICDTISSLEAAGAEVVVHSNLQQRYAVIDAQVAWYGNVDFLAFGKKDTNILRFVNADIAGELTSNFDMREWEQLMISDVPG